MFILSKSTVTSASALLSILLSSLPTAQAASAGILLYSGNSCTGDAIDFRPSIGGDGCADPFIVEHFQSARLQYSTGLSSVLLCPQGYPCDRSWQENIIPYTGECVAGEGGTFDKILLCH